MPRIRATYRVRSSAADIESVARLLALEQSVELPREAIFDRYVLDHVAGVVESITARGEAEFDIVVGLATETTGFDVAQTLNMLFGNSSLHEHIELLDAEFPADFLRRFRGPRFGIEGLRALVGAAGRPLTCAALKPQGLSSEALAGLCHTFALGGIDVIKDDHGLADQAWAPFARRVAACQRALERARRETGTRALYAPSLVGAPGALAAQARIVREEGVGMVLLAPALLGIPA